MSSSSSSTKDHRSCSALGRALTRMECASRRVSGIPCSSDCVHNPFGFAHYRRFLDLETRWFDKAIQRTWRDRREAGETYRHLPDLPVLREMAEVQRVMSELLGHSALEVGSPMERWATDPEARLTNDERVMTRYRIKTRATVIEIQRPVGEHRCVARDAFDPEFGEFLVFHPTLAKAPRFSRHLGWYTWFPHFVHPLGPMVELVPHLWFAWRDEVIHEVRHRHNQDHTMNCHRFLRENFVASLRVLGCLIEDWESTDEPVGPSSHSAAVYRVRDTIPKLKALFETNPACAPFLVLPRHPGYGDCRGEYRFRVRGAPENLEECPPYLGADRDSPGERTIGMISLYDEILLFHCYSRQALKLGRRFLEEKFEGRLEFDYEDTLELTDLAKCLEPAIAVSPLPLANIWKDDPKNARDPGAGEPASPEFLKRCRREMVRWLDDHHALTFAGFLDEPHFFLENRTPREASRSAQDRPKLVELMKVAIYEIDQRNRQFELALSIEPILRELGLAELLAGD